MFQVKKIASSCLAVALSAGVVLSTGGTQAFANESDGDTAFTADITVQAQNEDGSVHSIDSSIDSAVALEVSSDSLKAYVNVKAETMEFKDYNGEYYIDVVDIVNYTTVKDVVRTYSVDLTDITERVAANITTGGYDGDDSELYLAFTADDEVIQAISEVYTPSAEPTLSTQEVDGEDTLSLAEADEDEDTDSSDSEATLSLYAKSGSDLADGEYSIKIQARELDSDSVHTRDEDINEDAKLIVSGGNIDVYFSSVGRELTFQNSSGEFENKTESSEEQDDSEIRSDGMNLSTKRNYKLTVTSLDDIVTKFPAGGSATGSLTFRLVFLEDTLKEVNVDSTGDNSGSSGSNNSGSSNSSGSGSSGSSGSSSSGSSSSGSSSSGSSSSSPTTGDDSQMLITIIALVLAGSVGGFTLYLKRRESTGNLS